MARRRGKSSSGATALLIVFGLAAAAVAAVYRFVVENAAAVTAFAVVCGGILVLALVFTRVRSRQSGSLGGPELPPSASAKGRSGGSSNRLGANSPQASAARWVEASERVRVGAHEIAQGMFYLGSSIPVGDGTTGQYVVNPKLPCAARRPDIEGTTMPYWPSYADITPSARQAFLHWMASGRQDPSYGIGHVFLFFYGLEHRQFIDRDFAGTPLIVREVERLLSIYGESNSFRGYATNFLTLAHVASGASLETPRLTAERGGLPEVDIAVRLHLGNRLSQVSNLLSEDALLWVLALPDVYLRTAAVRCFEEFVSLWHLRFQTRFPEGIKVKTTGKIRLTYSAASGAFEVDIPGPHEKWPDVATATAPAALKTLVQECTEELDGFSRLIGRRPASRNSMQAALLLPADLRNEIGSGAFHNFAQRMTQLMGEHHRASTTMGNMLDAAGFAVPESSKVSPALADQLGDVLDHIDIAIEPDRRYSGSVPQLDDQIFIFKAARGGPVDTERLPYRSMKAQVEVAVLAAAADGEASGEELQEVIAAIRTGADLSGIEQARLIAFAVTIFNSPPKQARVMQRLAERSQAERETIANVAVAVIGRGESVNPGEVKFLERLHKALGLPKERVYSGLHRATSPTDEPVPISEEQRVAGVPIPRPEATPNASSAAGIQIDAGRLARTQRETQAVSELLANIFEEVPGPIEADSEVGPSLPVAFQGLDKAHAELVELLELKGAVPRIEFEQRAREMKLLPDGAIERINDWSFERFDESLFEDGDDVVLVPHLKQRLAELREAAT
jgi:tellurite resistance protein